jgi:cation transport regulator ChaB
VDTPGFPDFLDGRSGVPYATVSELPADVRKLSDHQQHVFLAAFNAALKEHPADEAKAFAIAHAAASQAPAAKSARDAGGAGGTLSAFFKALADLVGASPPAAAPGSQTSGLEDRVRFTKRVPIAKVDESRRLVYGVVYEPNVPDAHDDMMTADEIEKACHGFMRKYATLRAASGLEHQVDVGRDQVVIVENSIAPVDYRLGTQTVTKGSWVMVTKVLDDQIWADVQAQRYTGYSFEGWGRRVPAAA